ncbi:MAG TPA: thioesterase family protein [Anaerolineae bacterium]|nr:thioesterase family protein [Anaerolineae bacterium]
MLTIRALPEPAGPEQFRFSASFPIHYDHIDAQRHLNNVAYFLFMQQARLAYLREIGLWDGVSFDSVGMILLETGCIFHMPALYGETVTVWTRVSRLGTKSFDFEYRLVTEKGDVATGRSVQVCYDYDGQRSVPMPAAWRNAIESFEPALRGAPSP